jgi:hypothetical protein
MGGDTLHVIYTKLYYPPHLSNSKSKTGVCMESACSLLHYYKHCYLPRIEMNSSTRMCHVLNFSCIFCFAVLL